MSTHDTTTSGQPRQGGGATGKAQEKAQEAAATAQQKTQQAARQARGRVRDQVDTRSTLVGEQAESVAQDVRSVGEHLRGDGKDKPAELADRAATRVAELGDYLKRSDGDALLRDAERFGRERPWAVLAGGLVLGIAASRFLKASSSRRYQDAGSSTNLPARRADVNRAALSPASGDAASPLAPTPATQAPVGDVTTRVPGVPERDLSLTGGVLPPEQNGPGAGSRG